MEAAILTWFFHSERLKWARVAAHSACAVMLLAVAAAQAHAAAPKPSTTPKPELTLPLQDLGVAGVSAAFLNAGISVLTVHFVDSGHLLVTFNTRGLIPRLRDEPANDQDQVVAAVLVAVPSGAVVARTTWHLHDHGRYLWSLGNGRFLLRIRDSLSTFAPVANLREGHTFDRVYFPSRRGDVVGVDVSADGRLVTVETAPQRLVVAAATTGAASAGAASSAGSPSGASTPMLPLEERHRKPVVRLDVYRLVGTGAADNPIVGTAATSLHADEAVQLPMDGDGYLDTEEKPRNHWSVAFYPFGGKPLPLAPIDSNCPPTFEMVSRSQYVSMACRGLQGGTTLIAFDLEQHYIWEEPLGQLPSPPLFAYAPSAGRFAMSRRTSEIAATAENSNVTPATQEMRVYQTQTGDLLLKVKCDPVFQTPENFDIAADGMRVAVVRGGAIEVYRLPELGRGDREDLVQLSKITPPESTAKVDLRRLLEEEEHDAREAAAETAASEAKTAGSADVAPAVAPVAVKAESAPVGDTEAPRKPPTLLNPGEKPDFADKGNTPK